ncbi:glycerophosphoryl diester phosphodiesterase membrane domain-containing protein [Mucilaginibacter dorajii]|uniref:Glycerophosphoryl diester phosphodiesterase membrane domain-containing protein n=1 Tax=Mucilaginibacter dorajii TaxID=692994 RepID=A0ABP7QJ40_9SPHI|nr:glycerophosphoryl diester phosphodiesterase membrane domain-containing protein [Mucilaginibacter dorajii]MCS3734183.1 membrane-anchored glycerophosphoryl diester phosphodiesterase (GDPDase) [Mucilaginibacter dorajii]
MYHAFSVAETIKTAWNVLKRNFVPLVVYSVISLFIYEAVDFIKAFILIEDDIATQFIFIFIQLVVQCYIGLSFYKLILTLMDREYYEFEFKDILPSFKMTFNFVVIGLLTGVLVAVLVFFYVLAQRNLGYESLLKGIELIFILYISLRSIFCICFIVDDDSSPIESLKQSFEITKDNFFKTLGIFFIIIVILIIALIPVFLLINLTGLDAKGGFVFRLAFYCWFILTFPFIQVIIMVTYRKLVYSHKDVDDDIAETN